MKIPITEATIQMVATEIAEAAATIVRKHVVNLDEIELIRHLNANYPDYKERILGYLQNTKKGVSRDGTAERVDVTNSYLRAKLLVPIPALKNVREQLEAAKTIQVSGGDHAVIHWRYLKPAPAATPATTTAAGTKQ